MNKYSIVYKSLNFPRETVEAEDYKESPDGKWINLIRGDEVFMRIVLDSVHSIRKVENKQ